MKHDPIPALLKSKNEALSYFTSRDLLGENPGDVARLWTLPRVKSMLDSQQEGGGWKYHGGRQHIRSSEDYDQIETFRILRYLVEKYGFNRRHPALEKAAEFLFRHQTAEGDFRGICGNQYVPYYSAAFMELLVKSGYSQDPRIEKGFRWLLSIRQNDGGWAFPMRTVGLKLTSKTFKAKTVQPDRSKPFSHLVTGIVLRAFAAHPEYSKSNEAHKAGELLITRFFKADKYPDRQAPSFWTSFSFPFWFNDLLSSLNSLSKVGLESTNPEVKEAIEWFVSRQRPSGLWNLSLRIMTGEPERDRWVTFAICRMLKNFD